MKIDKEEHVAMILDDVLTKGRLLSVKDRKNLRLVSHYLRWLHCQVHTSLHTLRSSGLYQGDQEAWQIIESIIGHPAYADDDKGISRTDTHKFNDKDVVADESYTRVPNTVHKQLLKGGYRE